MDQDTIQISRRLLVGEFVYDETLFCEVCSHSVEDNKGAVVGSRGRSVPPHMLKAEEQNIGNVGFRSKQVRRAECTAPYGGPCMDLTDS